MIKKINLNDKLPSMNFDSTSNIKNSDSLSGKTVILYFYPKDNTSGCSKQAQDFRDAYPNFTKQNAEIIGVSRDSIKSHQKFIENFNLPFSLISDADEKLCQMFDVIKKKKLYGREYMGIERSTFLFDKTGTLCNEWRNVKVDGHVAEVLEAVKKLT